MTKYPRYPLEQKILWSVSISTEMRDFILKRRQSSDNADEDVLRRLVGMKPRKKIIS